jgi:hypothetical protein
LVGIDELALFAAAARLRCLGWWSAGSQAATFQNKGNQGDEDKKARHPKKQVVMQGFPARTGFIAALVSFVGMMMVLAHMGFLSR